MPTIYLKIEVDDIDPRQSLDVGIPLTLQELMDAAGSDLGATIVEAPPTSLRYIAVLHQPGGCDYTIACGTLVEHLTAKSFDKALSKAEALLSDYDGERSLDDLTVYEVTQRKAVDVRAAYKKMDAAKAATEVTRREAVEREQLANLTAKYGKP